MLIRTKLAIWLTLLVAVILLLLGGVLYIGYQRMLMDKKDFALKVVANILDSSLPKKPISKAVVQKTVIRVVTDYPDIEFKGTLIGVYDSPLSIVFSSSLSEKEWLPLTKETWDIALRGETALTTVFLHRDPIPIRILSKPVFGENGLLYVIQVGTSMQDILSTLNSFLLLSLVFVPMATLLVSLGGWWLVRKALGPLDGVVEAARRISAGDLRHRIDLPKSGREIGEVAAAFNQMTSRLQVSFDQIRDFTDNVSHELRIPLAILKGETELNLRRPRSLEKYQAVLRSNLEEILRMQKMVEKLLFLSKADRGEMELDLIEIDLSQLLKEIASQIQVTAREKGVSIRLDAGGTVYMNGDELLLRELLFNLTQNAIRHTPSGGEVTLGLSVKGGGIKLFVADTGIGIPSDEKDRIFDRFYQIDRSRSNKGRGLGLSICKSVVEAHFGTIQVESTLGRGSRFTVSFSSSLLGPLPLVKTEEVERSSSY
ncbi:MAG: heavy metal sensor histidine kinase [Candidatus Manganitrophaceae bacterium]